LTDGDWFAYDDAVACRSHLLEFDSIGSLAFCCGGEQRFLYSATRSELEAIAKDPSVTDIVVRSFRWSSLQRTVSRPLKVSNAYSRKTRWVTLEKEDK